MRGHISQSCTRVRFASVRSDLNMLPKSAVVEESGRSLSRCGRPHTKRIRSRRTRLPGCPPIRSLSRPHHTASGLRVAVVAVSGRLC